MLPSRSLPPLEFCFGTNPTQAEKSLPDRKALGSATLAYTATIALVFVLWRGLRDRQHAVEDPEQHENDGLDERADDLVRTCRVLRQDEDGLVPVDQLIAVAPIGAWMP